MKKPIDIGSRRELFVDDFMFTGTGNAKFVMHNPEPKELAVKRDTIGDDHATSYYSIVFDGSKYSLFYTGHGFGLSQGKWPHQHICRAESEDGIHWVKPNYGLYEFKGTKENNIVYLLENDLLDNFFVFYDPNPNCPANEKFKALLERVLEDGNPVLNAATSEDGIHWTDRGIVIYKGTFDSLNTCYFDEETETYYAYVRTWEDHLPGRNIGETRTEDMNVDTATRARSIVRLESKDFFNWSEPEPLYYGTCLDYQMYTNNIMPYYRAKHIIIGFPTRYYARPWRRLFKEIPSSSVRKFTEEDTRTGFIPMTDGLFMSSRDGLNFKRYDSTPFFPSGPEGKGNWVYGDAYPAYGMIETPSDRPLEPNQISMLVPDNAYNGLRRHVIRLDGFVSLHAETEPEVILTKPFTFKGNRLEFNYKTTVAGGFKVELLDEYRNPYPGFEMDKCDEMFGDTVARDISWNEQFDVSSLEGKTVYMRIKMYECDLFSFRFYNK